MKKTSTPRAGAAKRAKRRASRLATAAHTPDRAAPPAEETVETPGRRMHGDSYSDVVSHEDDGVGSSFASLQPDARQEEPSDAALGASERLEGST